MAILNGPTYYLIKGQMCMSITRPSVLVCSSHLIQFGVFIDVSLQNSCVCDRMPEWRYLHRQWGVLMQDGLCGGTLWIRCLFVYRSSFAIWYEFGPTDCLNNFQGGSWVLVRHAPQGTTWHPVEFEMKWAWLTTATNDLQQRQSVWQGSLWHIHKCFHVIYGGILNILQSHADTNDSCDVVCHRGSAICLLFIESIRGRECEWFRLISGWARRLTKRPAAFTAQRVNGSSHDLARPQIAYVNAIISCYDISDISPSLRYRALEFHNEYTAGSIVRQFLVHFVLISRGYTTAYASLLLALMLSMVWQNVLDFPWCINGQYPAESSRNDSANNNLLRTNQGANVYVYSSVICPRMTNEKYLTKWLSRNHWSAVCTSACQNGGTCVSYNTCSCPSGWAGLQCQTKFSLTFLVLYTWRS
jgi:hypothetical protein